MERVLPVLVVVLALLAGCSGLLPGPSADTPTATPASTATQTTTAPPVTPTATATDRSTATPALGGDLAPGITDEGVVNPVALQSAHRSALLADGFTLAVTYENVANGSVQWRTAQRIVAGPGGELALQRATAGDPPASVTNQTVWHNVTHTTMRSLEGDETRFTVRSRVATPEALVWPGPVLRLLQDEAGAFEVSSVEEREGLRVVTLAASLDQVGRDGDDDTTATMVVDERGVLRSLTATTDYGGSDAWRVTYTVERVGGVDPEPPDWLEEVPRNASLNVELFTGMGPEGVLTLENVGGDTVPADTHVTVRGNGTLREARLADPLAPGETLYVFVAPETGALRLSTSEPAEGVYEPVPREFTVRVVTGDGVVLHEESLGW